MIEGEKKTRMSFSQVLKNASVDIRREYTRLYALFYVQKIRSHNMNEYTLRDLCAANFINVSFRGTCISLNDFDYSHKYIFEEKPSKFDIDYLIRFCEYSYNLLLSCQSPELSISFFDMQEPMHFYIQQVDRVIEAIGYIHNWHDGITDFVPKDQVAISVAEIIDPSLSYRVIEYNHHSMTGDIERKKSVIVALADMLEPQRKKLGQIDKSLEDNLFYLFNNMNLRHNNANPEGNKYNPAFSNMKTAEIEKWYDDTYQMCLLAFLELDNIERKERVDKLKKTHKNRR